MTTQELNKQEEIEIDRDLGNTEETRSHKQANQLIHYGFTWNNYENRDIEMLISVLDELCYMYVFQEENEGTRHLQGTLSLKKRMRWTEFGLSNRIHWEFPVKNLSASYEYCSRKNKRKGGVWGKNYKFTSNNLNLIKIQDLYEWQNRLILLCMAKPHPRNIYWIYGSQGVGKTSFIKYMVENHKAIILSGKPSDMKNGIVNYYNKNSIVPNIIMSNIGYDKDLNRVHYSGYEDIKDMCFYSGKYEGGMICGSNPHLIIFANGPAQTKNKKFININIDNYILRRNNHKELMIEISQMSFIQV